MPHVVLLGDSIFDNAAYVSGGPDVIAQLQEALPTNWDAALLAVDGACVMDVYGQLAKVPGEATHLVLSIGGNDALGHADILERPARSSGEVLDQLAEIARNFERAYAALVKELKAKGLPLTLCTIYRGALPDPTMQRRASVALSIFNEAILNVAIREKLEVIDLRMVCSEPGDYANPIEPSVQGGQKIAKSIAMVVTAAADEKGGAMIFAPVDKW